MSTDRPGIAEQYDLATTTSDLTLRPHSRGAADVLIASGLSKTDLSAGLVHLRAQWPQAKPRKFTEDEVSAHAGRLPKRNGKPDTKRARTEMLIAYYVATKRAAEALPGRTEVVRILLEWAQKKGIDPEIVGPSLSYWIDRTCPVCDGHGFRKLPDAPALSTKQCHHCHGSGHRVKPLGADRILGYIAYTLSNSRYGMVERLYG